MAVAVPMLTVLFSIRAFAPEVYDLLPFLFAGAMLDAIRNRVFG